MTRNTALFTGFVAALCLGWAGTSAAQPASQPLVIQDITCAGNDTFSCEFLREHLYQRQGEILDEEEIRNAELRLAALRNFESVAIRLEKGERRGAVIVVIEVREASPVRVESVVGAAYWRDMQLANVAGRVSHHNLFGQGKVAELSVAATTPFAGDSVSEGAGVTFTYADPHLFGSNRYFAVASAALIDSRGRDRYGNFNDYEGFELNLGVGRRFGDFSYVAVELNHRPDSGWSYGWWNSDAIFEQRRFEGRGTKATLLYGWSTEDDLQFPTQGSALQLAVRRDFGANGPDRYPFLRYRKTWQTLGGYLSFKAGGEPTPEYRSTLAARQPLALNYSRAIAPGDSIERGRWFIEPGIANVVTTSTGDSQVGYGLRLGLRAETRQFGLVELYLFGVAESVR